MVRSIVTLITPRNCEAVSLGFTLSRPLAAQGFPIRADGVWAGDSVCLPWAACRHGWAEDLG